MTEALTPRQMVKAWLRGEPLSRPLLIPIIFSLGARLENLSLRDFQSNPTKIANALRQIRNVLKVDGVTCYYDPLLEAEALACSRHWQGDGSSTITCPSFSSVDDLRDRLTPLEDLSRKGSIPVACEVLRRLKVMLRDEPALMVRVTGPLTLAAQLQGIRRGEPPAQEVVAFAAEVVAGVAKILLEAGADVILLKEDAVLEMSSEAWGWYTSLLAPVVNVIRFYEALPVLSPGAVAEASLAALLGDDCGWVVCCTPPSASSGQRCTGLALPSQDFHDPSHLSDLVLSRELTLLTSADDIAETVEVKHLSNTLSALRERLSDQRYAG